LTINHSSLTINYMSAPPNHNTNRLFSDINCIHFTTQNDFSKTDVDGLAPHNPINLLTQLTLPSLLNSTTSTTKMNKTHPPDRVPSLALAVAQRTFSVRAGNMKITSVLSFYNTACLNTDITDINFRTPNHKLIINH